MTKFNFPTACVLLVLLVFSSCQQYSSAADVARKRHRANHSYRLIPVFPFEGEWISPLPEGSAENYAGSEWIVVGTRAVSRSRIVELDKKFHGISCDYTNEGDPVHKFKILPEIGIPIFACGPIKTPDNTVFLVESGRRPDTKTVERLGSRVAEKLYSEYKNKDRADVAYHDDPVSFVNERDERVPVGQMVVFSSGAIVFQWEQMESTNTFKKCVRIIDSSGDVSSCKEINDHSSAEVWRYVFYHIENREIGLNIYVAITTNEPWQRSAKFTTWGPERKVFKFHDDVSDWENFDSFLDPLCSEI